MERDIQSLIKKKITIVTGAGRGIGYSIAKNYLDEGHYVYFIVHKLEQKKKILDNISKNNNYEIFYGDLTKKKFLKNLEKKIKYCNNLINNAASTNKKFFCDVTEKDYDILTNINLKSAFFLSQIFVKKMIKNKIKGNIINISSQLGHIGAYNRTAYCITKFGIEGFTKSLSLDLSKHGIRVNSISPTKTLTHGNEITSKSKRLKIIKNKIPLKKFTTSEEIAQMTYYITENIKNMTGCNIKIDGGWTAGY